MKIELNLSKRNENYVPQHGDIVKDNDGDLYLVVTDDFDMYNLLGLTYRKGKLFYLKAKTHENLIINDLPVELVEKSKNVTIEIKTKGE